MQRVIRATVGVAIYTALVCVVDIEVLQMQNARFDPAIFSLLGIVLSILLAFRTSTAYDRWWEGRQQWGSLVNRCRNLAITLHVALPLGDKGTRHYVAVRISNFCLALKEHLRLGVVMDELINCTEEDLKNYSSKTHVPNAIASELFRAVQEQFLAGNIRGEDHLNVHYHTQELLNILGACERIKKTPIPFSYNVYLKIFIMLYTLLIPLALIPVFGWWSIPMVSFVFFAFIGIELMAEEIEDPFGLDCNDLPTGTIALTIRDNVFEILEAGHMERKQPELYDKLF